MPPILFVLIQTTVQYKVQQYLHHVSDLCKCNIFIFRLDNQAENCIENIVSIKLSFGFKSVEKVFNAFQIRSVFRLERILHSQQGCKPFIFHNRIVFHKLLCFFRHQLIKVVDEDVDTNAPFLVRREADGM